MPWLLAFDRRLLTRTVLLLVLMVLAGLAATAAAIWADDPLVVPAALAKPFHPDAWLWG